MLNTKNIIHDEYSHGGKAFIYMCMSIYKDREEKRVLTEQEKREKYQQSIADDIRRGIAANRAQFTDTYDYDRIEDD